MNICKIGYNFHCDIRVKFNAIEINNFLFRDEDTTRTIMLQIAMPIVYLYTDCPFIVFSAYAFLMYVLRNNIYAIVLVRD